jgi:HAD superfamily hydrolase (TIGR01509 family)
VDKQLLIFDFDGTIANTSPLHAQAFADTLSPLGLSVCYSHIAGLRTAEAMLSCFDDAGLHRPSPEDLQYLVGEKQRRVRQLISTSLEPLPRMDAFLHWAKTRYQMALVTSGSRATVSLALRKIGYVSLFQTMIFAEDVNSSKPDPEGLRLALQAHRCQPKHALVFEDSEAGFQAAISANVRYINIIDYGFLS